MVASKAISDRSPLAGRAWIYRPRRVSDLVWDLRPLLRRCWRSRGASILSASIVSPIFTGLPPSHQAELVLSKTSPVPVSAGTSSWEDSETVLTRVFFYPHSHLLRLQVCLRPRQFRLLPLQRRHRPGFRSSQPIPQLRSQPVGRDRA